MTHRYAAFIILILTNGAAAQFTSHLLENDSYWADGKAEFNFYDAQIMREGQPHECELLTIFTLQALDSTTLEQLNDRKKPGALPAIEMNQVVTVPRGLALEQRSLRAVWRLDFMSLTRISVAGNDGIGQIIKSIYELRDKDTQKVTWQYRCDTYRERADLQELEPPKEATILYDELPLRIRTLDFTKTSGEADMQLLPSLLGAERRLGEFKPAKVSWKTGERSIEATVRHDAGTDRFVLDRDFPFLLREWQMADGSRLKMKNSLKVDYRNYLKNGDRERALKDPMLRHPD